MPNHDTSRPVPSGPDFEYSLSVEQCADQYALAGHARTPRTIQRYCTNSALEAKKVTTLTGDRYLVTPHSLFRHIDELNQLAAQSNNQGQSWTSYDALVGRDRFRTRQESTHSIVPGRDIYRPAPTPPAAPRPVIVTETLNGSTVPDDLQRQAPSPVGDADAGHNATGGDRVNQAHRPIAVQSASARPDASGRDIADHGTHHRANENDFLRSQLVAKDLQIAVKDKQIEAKDGQIASLLERDRETNILMQSLQQILRPLLPSVGFPIRRDGQATQDDA
jgi:hypothetical protein